MCCGSVRPETWTWRGERAACDDREDWVVCVEKGAKFGGAIVTIVTIVTLGPGLASGAPPRLNPQVADTFEFRVLRR